MAFEESGESSSIFGSIGNSFKGMLTGVVLFPLSLFLIFKVETCEQASAALKGALPASQAKPGIASYVTGKLSADTLSGEFVKPGKYISYSQSSEVYAWNETSKEDSKTKKQSMIVNWIGYLPLKILKISRIRLVSLNLSTKQPWMRKVPLLPMRK